MTVATMRQILITYSQVAARLRKLTVTSNKPLLKTEPKIMQGL